MALCCDYDILRIFGFDNEGDTDPAHSNEASDVMYISYLQMVSAKAAVYPFLSLCCSILDRYLDIRSCLAYIDYVESYLDVIALTGC